MTTLSREQIDALRAAGTRDEAMTLLIAVGAPIRASAGSYMVRADHLIWLIDALGLTDAVIFAERDD